MGKLTLQEYIDGMEDAISVNPPHRIPAYETDPEGIWRYYMRNFGHGLAEFDEKEVMKHLGEWYSRWFVRHETFAKNKVHVNAKEFNEWILGAMRESQEKRLTQRAADALCLCFKSVPAKDYPDLCAHCGKPVRR